MGSPPVTTLDAALKGITHLGFDTSPFIYLVERNPSYLSLCREVFKRVDAGAVMGYTSVVTLTEVLVVPLRVGNAAVEKEYRDLLRHGRNISILSIDISVAETAADLRARYNLRTPDALQMAAAIEAGCQAFLTNDAGLKRVTELTVLTLDELEL